MARAMGTNAYGKEPRRGERTLSRGFTHRRAPRAFLRPCGAGASLGRSPRAYALGRSPRAYALGYFLAPLTGLRTAHAQDWHDAKNSASRRRRGLKSVETSLDTAGRSACATYQPAPQFMQTAKNTHS